MIIEKFVLMDLAKLGFQWLSMKLKSLIHKYS